MKLYLITQTTNKAFDRYDAAVVVAANEVDAALIHPGEGTFGLPGWNSDWCESPTDVRVMYIGEASPELKAGDVICKSYIAG